MVTLVDFPFMIVFVGVLWAIGGMVALVPTLIIPLVIIVAATIHPLIKGYAEKNLNASQGKLGVLLELLGNIETVKTVSGGEYLKTKCTPKDKKYPWSEQEYECPPKPTNDK